MCSSVVLAASPHGGADERDDEAAATLAEQWMQSAAPSTLRVASSRFYTEKVETLLRPAMGEEFAAWARSLNGINSVAADWQGNCLAQCASKALDIIAARSEGDSAGGDVSGPAQGAGACAELQTRLHAWQHVIEKFQVSALVSHVMCTRGRL